MPPTVPPQFHDITFAELQRKKHINTYISWNIINVFKKETKTKKMKAKTYDYFLINPSFSFHF